MSALGKRRGGTKIAIHSESRGMDFYRLCKVHKKGVNGGGGKKSRKALLFYWDRKGNQAEERSQKTPRTKRKKS